MKKTRVSREAAQASLLPRGAKASPPPLAFRKFVLSAARRIERLQIKRRTLRRTLRVLEEEIRAVRREMRAALGALDADLDQAMPGEDE